MGRSDVWYQTIYLCANSLSLNSVFTYLKNIKQILYIEEINSAPFLPYFDTQPSIYKIFIFLHFVCKNSKKFN